MALALNFAQRPLAGTAFCGKSFRSFGLLPIVLNQRHMTAVPKSQRPISPHVTIYKFPIPAISSIANRFCGAGLTMGMIDFYLILKHLGILTAGLLSLSGPDEVALALDNFKHHLPILVPFATYRRNSWAACQGLPGCWPGKPWYNTTCSKSST